MTPKAIERIRRAFPGFLVEVQSHVKDKKLSGQVLNRITGTLSRSIHTQPLEEDAGGITGRVTAGVDAPYGKLHEEQLGNPFMAPTLQEKEEAFYRMIREAVHEALT